MSAPTGWVVADCSNPTKYLAADGDDLIWSEDIDSAIFAAREVDAARLGEILGGDCEYLELELY